jgi:hypothetical protein
MKYSEIAKQLGRRGGLKRAKNLSTERKKEIAQMGAKARMESIEIARRIHSNFAHLAFIHALNPPPKVESVSTCDEKLPGIYDS